LSGGDSQCPGNSAETGETNQWIRRSMKLWRGGPCLIIRRSFANLFEGALNKVFPLFAKVVVDRAQGLHDAGGGTGECELAVCHFAFVQRERAVTKRQPVNSRMSYSWKSKTTSSLENLLLLIFMGWFVFEFESLIPPGDTIRRPDRCGICEQNAFTAKPSK
jgi:hypothetical protein